MNAQELTKIVNRVTSEMQDVKRELEFLQQEREKIRRMLSDIQIDIKMFENTRIKRGKIND